MRDMVMMVGTVGWVVIAAMFVAAWWVDRQAVRHERQMEVTAARI